MLQFNKVKDTALAMIKLATDSNGDFINPRLCASRRPSIVNYDEEYTEVYITSKGHSLIGYSYMITEFYADCKSITDDKDIDDHLLTHPINT